MGLFEFSRTIGNALEDVTDVPEVFVIVSPRTGHQLGFATKHVADARCNLTYAPCWLRGEGGSVVYHLGTP